MGTATTDNVPRCIQDCQFVENEDGVIVDVAMQKEIEEVRQKWKTKRALAAAEIALKAKAAKAAKAAAEDTIRRRKQAEAKLDKQREVFDAAKNLIEAFQTLIKHTC